MTTSFDAERTLPPEGRHYNQLLAKCIHSSLYAKRRCVWIKRDKVHKCSLPGDHLRKVIHKS